MVLRTRPERLGNPGAKLGTLANLVTTFTSGWNCSTIFSCREIIELLKGREKQRIKPCKTHDFVTGCTLQFRRGLDDEWMTLPSGMPSSELGERKKDRPEVQVVLEWAWKGGTIISSVTHGFDVTDGHHGTGHVACTLKGEDEECSNQRKLLPYS